jgi:hypothetical protein
MIPLLLAILGHQPHDWWLLSLPCARTMVEELVPDICAKQPYSVSVMLLIFTE